MDIASSINRVLSFSAIVGQEELKRALLMLAVNPRLGGVLIRGEKGTAKSTAARGLASLLPPERANAGCSYGCPTDLPDVWCDDCRGRAQHEAVLRRPPFESLPLGVTEDQLLGSMDLEHALRHGERQFSPGLLARVNRGVLYVDEVNLLEDHLVDLLLDVAAFGVNVVAREGVSVTHPSEFMLVGTMNPEEGELRPQLLDRFGLCAEVESLDDVEARGRVVQRRLAFEADPVAFREQWQAAERELAERVVAARALLPRIVPDDSLCVAAARLSTELGVHGHRSDLLLVKGAATLAALEGRGAIDPEDFVRVAPLALRHRLRRAPFEEIDVSVAEIATRAGEIVAASKKKSRVDHIVTETEVVEERDGGSEHQPCMGPDAQMVTDGAEMARVHHPGAPGAESVAVQRASAGAGDRSSEVDAGGLLDIGLWGSGEIVTVPAEAEPVHLSLPTRLFRRLVRLGAARQRGSDGRHTILGRGRSVGAMPMRGSPRDVAWEATILSVAHRQAQRPHSGRLAFDIELDDLLGHKRVRPPDHLLMIVVDASGSMAGELTAAARQLAEQALARAYVDRQQVAMIAFRSRGAELLFGPTSRVERARRALETLPLGGATPLGRGLDLAHTTLRRAAAHASYGHTTVLVISDGDANVGDRNGYGSAFLDVEQASRKLIALPDTEIVLLDTTEPGKDDRPALWLAEQLQARHVKLRDARH